MAQYEEYATVRPPWHWVILIVLCVLLVAWGLWIFFAVPDAPRQWDSGTLPDTPGASIYSAERPPKEKTPQRQIAPLPEAHPKERVNK